MPAERATLYSLQVSHPALAVRGMLDLKGIEYRVVDLLPGMQPVMTRALRFRGGTVPALVIDGRRGEHSGRLSRLLGGVPPRPPPVPARPGGGGARGGAGRRGGGGGAGG